MYDTSNPDHETRRDKRPASGFQPDAEMERLLEMREKQPEKFERIASPNLRLQVGYYESARAAAARTEGDNS